MTPDNCVVALIDHQGQMLFGTSNFDRWGIINNTVAFAMRSLGAKESQPGGKLNYWALWAGYKF